MVALLFGNNRVFFLSCNGVSSCVYFNISDELISDLNSQNFNKDEERTLTITKLWKVERSYENWLFLQLMNLINVFCSKDVFFVWVLPVSQSAGFVHKRHKAHACVSLSWIMRRSVVSESEPVTHPPSTGECRGWMSHLHSCFSTASRNLVVCNKSQVWSFHSISRREEQLQLLHVRIDQNIHLHSRWLLRTSRYAQIRLTCRNQTSHVQRIDLLSGAKLNWLFTVGLHLAKVDSILDAFNLDIKSTAEHILLLCRCPSILSAGQDSWIQPYLVPLTSKCVFWYCYTL